MPVDFQKVNINSEWDRRELAKLWGYRSFHALGRGIFTPSSDSKIVLFVTEEKQQSATQYQDTLNGDVLHWEGASGHQNDQRIAEAKENGDKIHVFYRKRHHQPFTYLGQVEVVHATILNDKPSSFVLRVRK
jgi:hypothetical protein